MEKAKGLVHLYVGDGKGKTTAALGLAIRFAGHGGRVMVVQFLKGRPTGELAALEQLGVTVCRCPGMQRFYSELDAAEREICLRQHLRCLSEASRALSGGYDLVVLDEVVDAVSMGLLPFELLRDAVENRNQDTEVVLTGHGMDLRFSALADYITEMRCIRHPFERGIAARKGVEF